MQIIEHRNAESAQQLNVESGPYNAFIKRYPAYGQTEIIDRIRASDFSRLDRSGHVYVDYCGSSLYGESLLDESVEFLKRSILGNPHSYSSASMASTQSMEEARFEVLNFFNADPHEYVAIFTANASSAIRLVGESFLFSPKSCLVMLEDNHNSVLGLRCFAKAAGSEVFTVALAEDMQADDEKLSWLLTSRNSNQRKLFAYPAQSNYSGVKHSLDYVSYAQDRGWETLLDAAAFVPTSRLDLGSCKPSFVVLSFYKMFGFPTGIGCLLARRESLAKLSRPWFSGGAVLSASSAVDHNILADGEAGFEDGTVNFAAANSVISGLRLLKSIGYSVLNDRLSSLTEWLILALQQLKHDSGRDVVEIYGPQNPIARGATIALSVRDPSGSRWDIRVVEVEANKQNISLRAGVHCNPGANERAMKISTKDLVDLYATAADNIDEFLIRQDQIIGGAIRISLGLVSNFADVLKVLQLFESFKNRDFI